MRDQGGVAESDVERVLLRHGRHELTHEALPLRSDALARTLREQRFHAAVVGYWGERDLNWAMAAVASLATGLRYIIHNRAEPLHFVDWPSSAGFALPVPGAHQRENGNAAPSGILRMENVGVKGQCINP